MKTSKWLRNTQSSASAFLVTREMWLKTLRGKNTQPLRELTFKWLVVITNVARCCKGWGMGLCGMGC